MIVSCLLFAFVETIFFGILAVAMIGFFITFVAVGSQSLVQVEVANKLRGRVSSLWTIIVLGSPALGSFLAGSMFSKFGARATVIIFSLTCLTLLVMISWYLSYKQGKTY